MNSKKAVKELEKQLRKQPGNLVLRIRLAAALYDGGRVMEAIELYRSVAIAYFTQGRLEQAMAVCFSLLGIAPGHHETERLLADIDTHRAARSNPAMPVDPNAMPGLSQAESRRPRYGGFGDTDGFTPGSEPDMLNAPTTLRDTGPIEREGSGLLGVGPPGGAPGAQGPGTSRFPLPFVRTVMGPAPVPGEDGGAREPAAPFAGRGRPSSIGPTPPQRRPGDSSPPARPITSRTRSTMKPPMAPLRPPNRRPLPTRARSTGDTDDDAPTQIADKWVMPIRAREEGANAADGGPTMPVVARPGPAGRDGRKESAAREPPWGHRPGKTIPPPTNGPPRRRPSSLPIRPPPGPPPMTPPAPASLRPDRIRRDTPTGMSDVFTAPAAPLRRRSSGEAAGEAEATLYDDGMELARVLGQPYGEGGEPPPETALPGHLPALAGLPERAVAAIATGMVRRRVPSGELILREGEGGESCFVLARGEARVLKRDPLQPRGDLVEVSRLGEGDLFGEVAMLSDRRRHASVQAVADCELLEIPRAHLMQVAGRFPEVNTFLQKFYRDRLIATLLATAPFFRPLDPSHRATVVSRFQFAEIAPGARIIQEGARAGGFYLIVLGAVEITKQVSERRHVLLATLGEGSYFGEMSLLRGEVARASVTATGPSELAVLPAKNFYALVANHPILWDQVRQEAHRRELEMVQIVAGMTGAV